MTALTITRVTVIDYAEWNSSYDRNVGPELNPRWTLEDSNAEFRALLEKLRKTARVNDAFTLEVFLTEQPAVERQPEEPVPSGASPAHTEVSLWLSDGRRLTVGQYPLYSLGPALSELVALARRAGRHDVFDLKTDSP